MLTELKFTLTLELHIFKKHIEEKAKRRWHSSHLPKSISRAFTIAEILITLTIIGVVAALSIPTLMNNINNTTSVTQLKKTYSILQQAFMLVQTDNSGDIASIFNSINSNANIMNVFATKLNVIKSCPGTGGNCWYNTPIYNLSPSYSSGSPVGVWSSAPDSGINRAKAQLLDGTLIMFDSYKNNCTSDYSTLNDGNPLDGKVCGSILVDVNGFTGPNRWGRDVFAFWTTQTNLFPWGTSYDTTFLMDTWCGDATTSGYKGYGVGCTAKVLTEGAMNY